jgi:cytosine/adenosine deaminase-related metal-dependent hydrolase
LNPSEAVDTNLVEAFFYKIEAHMTEDDVRAFVRVGGLEAMMSGTGLVWDHYYYPEAITAGLRDIGLSGVVAPTLQDRGGPGTSALEANLEATLTIAKSDTLKRAGIYSAIGLHASDTVSQSLLRRCADLANTHRLPIHCHVAQSYEELERVHRLDGCGSGEHLLRSGILDSAPKSLLVHGILLTDHELEQLGKKNVTLAFCPHSKQIFAYLPDLHRWLTHNVEWVVGTDCAASNDAWSIPRELRFVAGMRALSASWSPAHQSYLNTGRLAHAQDAWTARTAARTATSVLGEDSYILARGWKVPGGLHPSFHAGEIAVGAKAQFAVWDTSHPCFWPNKNLLRALVWGRTQGALKRLMINGAWWSDQEHMGSAVTESDLWRESAKEASERLDALLKRAR